MSPLKFRPIGPAIAILAVGLACLVQAQDPKPKPTTGQRIGEKLDEAYQDAKGGLKKAGDSIRGEFSKTKASVHNMGMEARIYGRLHWDKLLKNATIDLSVAEGGVVTLEGAVATEKAKLRAVDLAQETDGVERVVDHLAVQPEATRTAPEKP